MIRRALLLPALLATAILTMGAASDPSERLPDPKQEARARALFTQVRCMMCQNESIDDSEAEIAHDLRMSIRAQIAAGKSDDEIRAFLVARFGQFVMLRPAFDMGTAFLWGAPLVVLIGGGTLLALLLRRKIPGDDEPGGALTEDEEKRLSELTGSSTDKASS